MDESKKKKIMIGIIIACLVLAGTMFIVTNIGGGTTGLNRPVQMLCTECEAGYEMTAGKFKEQMEEKMAEGGADPMTMGPTVRPIALTCPECDEDAAFLAVKCPECEYIFVRGEAGYGYPDTCPECEYSAIETITQKSR